MIDVDTNEALKTLMLGENLCITGPAGSGKTYLIKEWAKNSKLNVALTATTGIAALNLGGETIHRFLKLKTICRPEYAERIIGTWRVIKKSSKPWDKVAIDIIENIDALVIDEASMLRRDQLELINIVLSSIRDDYRPFGGIQVVLVGDFFQLPPVVTVSDVKEYPDLARPYCFQSDIWNSAKIKSLNLTTNYRQSDKEFLNLLNKIRVGKIDADIVEKLNSCMGRNIPGNLKPVKVFSHKVDVAKENIAQVKALKEKVYASMAEYTGNKIAIKILKDSSQAEDNLYFCKNAQIMMITNDPKDRWVNGTMGIITEIDPLTIVLSNNQEIKPELNTWEKNEYVCNNGKFKEKTVATMTQYPFKISYSSTTHRSQGLTLDYIDLDISKCFAPGQAYVALSRARTLDGLYIKNWNKKSIKADPIVKTFYGVEE